MATQYNIVFWNNESSYATTELRDLDDPDIIEPEYIDLLFQYRELIGVMAVQKDNKIITWQLNGCWYSSDEIQRMLKLKSFS